MIDKESEINPFDESGEKPSNTSGALSLRGINFSYPTRPDITVLEDFTLNIPAGKVTALVVSSSRPGMNQSQGSTTELTQHEGA